MVLLSTATIGLWGLSVAPLHVNYTLLQFVVALASTSIIVSSQARVTENNVLDVVLTEEMDTPAEYTHNYITNLMIEQIQTREGQGELLESATRPCNENMHIKEVKDDIQKLKKEKSALEKTKKLERKEQFKVNQQKLKHELPDVKNEQKKFKMDVQQQQLYTVQQKLKADHQGLNKELLKIIHNLKQEKGYLQKKIEELTVGEDKEKETVQRLQCEGQLCDMNCVSLAILWICKHKLESMNFIFCAPQFVILITLHAFLEGKLPHMPRCGYFMNTLQNVEIVRKVYECEMNGELEINEAWETLMKMNERVCILAKCNAQGEGHVVVCDLDTRTSKTKDGKVMFHDRQALPSSGRRRVEMSLQKFIEYVNNVILMLYTVDLEELNRIMVHYKDVLHFIELPHSCARIG